MKELDYIDNYRILMKPRANFLDNIVSILKPMDDLVSQEERVEQVIKDAQEKLDQMDGEYTQAHMETKATFYREARKTVGRGILFGLIK